MKPRVIPILIIIAAFAVGCKPADNATDASKPDTSKMASNATAGDAAKPADTAGAADAAKPADDSGNSVVGKWAPESKDMPPGAEVDFTADGKATLSFALGKVNAEEDATYTLDGNKLTINATSMKATAAADASADEKKQADAMNKAAPDQVKKNPKHEGTIKWVDKDNFEETSTDAKDKGTVTKYKRKA